MIITPETIEVYNKCPAKVYYKLKKTGQLFEKLPLEGEPLIASKVIKSVYRDTSRGKSAHWLKTRKYAEYFLSQATEDLTKQKLSNVNIHLSILERLQEWFTYYTNECNREAGLPNVPISFKLSDLREFQDTVDIIGFGDIPKIYDFATSPSTSYSIFNLKNSWSVYSRIWGVYKATNILVEQYIRYLITPMCIKTIILKVDKTLFFKISKMIKHMIDGIILNIYTPSFSEECPKCPYLNICKL